LGVNLSSLGVSWQGGLSQGAVRNRRFLYKHEANGIHVGRQQT
jgi:hypothetical protein